MTLIEFIVETPKRKVGEQLRVDDASARSFVDVKKVAKRVDETAPEAVVAEPAPPARKASTAPAVAGGGE